MRHPRALDHKAQIRYLRAVQARSSPRDKALALVPFYAGARIAETIALDLDDVRLSARKGILRIYGKGNESGRSQSTPSCARRSPTGYRNAAIGRLETTRDYTRPPPRTATKPSICCPSTSSATQGQSTGS